MRISLSDLSRSISDVVKDVAKGVVTIFTVIPSIDILLGQRPIKGAGSGFVIDPNGLIVTNAHVVKGASRIKVMLPTGESDYASLIAIDPYRDLALIKTKFNDLHPLKLGNSDEVRVGEIVFAVGSPLGLPGPTVTMGVVSAIGRTIVGRDIVLEDLIQTDAAINPGNSGGPLINALGEVIGVTTAIIPYAQGIGFAIPINTVKRFIELVRRYGKPIRAWIGAYVAQITPEVASAYGLPINKGLIIVRVAPGTPAQEVGLRAGDIIVKANGKEVIRVKDLKETIEDSIDRGFVKLEIVRDLRRYLVKVPIVIEVPY